MAMQRVVEDGGKDFVFEQGCIEFVDVKFGYSEKSILQGRSLSFPAGKTMALVGESGVGKTTTLSLAMSLTCPPPFMPRCDTRAHSASATYLE